MLWKWGFMLLSEGEMAFGPMVEVRFLHEKALFAMPEMC